MTLCRWYASPFETARQFKSKYYIEHPRMLSYKQHFGSYLQNIHYFKWVWMWALKIISDISNNPVNWKIAQNINFIFIYVFADSFHKTVMDTI
jgi:hypothetical protein